MNTENGKPRKTPNRLTDRKCYELIEHCKKHADEIRNWTGTKTELAKRIADTLEIDGGLSPQQLDDRLAIVDVVVGSDVIDPGDETRLLRAAIRRNEREIDRLRAILNQIYSNAGAEVQIPAGERSPLDPPGVLPFDDDPPPPRDLGGAAIAKGEFLKP